MKKILYTFLIATMATGTAFAQDEEASTGSDPVEMKADDEKKACCSSNSRLPVAGDIGLGIAANPFLQYAGNLLGGGVNNAPTFNFAKNNEIVVKYFLEDDLAIRASLRLNQNNTSYEADVWTGNEADAYERVIDTRTRSTGTTSLGIGVEKRRGYKNVQGYVGGELTFSRTSTREIFTYANEMSAAEQAPITYNGVWGNVSGTSISVTDANGDAWIGYSKRKLADYSPTITTFGLNGIIGVEYFIFPKVSLAGEFKLGYAYGKTKNDGEEQWQILNGSGSVVEEVKVDQGSTSKNYGLNTTTGGNIILNLYF